MRQGCGRGRLKVIRSVQRQPFQQHGNGRAAILEPQPADGSNDRGSLGKGVAHRVEFQLRRRGRIRQCRGAGSTERVQSDDAERKVCIGFCQERCQRCRRGLTQLFLFEVICVEERVQCGGRGFTHGRRAVGEEPGGGCRHPGSLCGEEGAALQGQ